MVSLPLGDASVTRGAALAAPSSAPAARNFAWLAGDKFVSTLLGLLVFGLIARRYGPAGSGHYAYALTLLQTALGLSLVCSAAAILPRLARMRRGVPAALANVFVVRLAGSFAALAIVAGYAALAIADPARLAVALLVLATVPLVEPFAAATMVWQARNCNRVPVLNRAAGLAARASVVALAVANDAPLWVPALGWIVEVLLVAFLQARSVATLGGIREFALRVSRWRASRYFRYGARFMLGIAFEQLYARGDRLVLAQLLPAHEFGIYATGMQLVDVWRQVANLLGVSIGPAFLYAAIEAQPRLRHHWRTLAALAGVGLAGLAGAVLLGPRFVASIFGPRFAGSVPYVIAGAAVMVLAFVDVLVAIRIAVQRQAGALAAKWAASAAVAIAGLLALYPSLGAYAGPAGLALGMAAGWIVVALLDARTAKQG